MSSGPIQITGTAMAVIVGIILIISPWTTTISFWYKLLLTIIGVVLCWLGIIFSKG